MNNYQKTTQEILSDLKSSRLGLNSSTVENLRNTYGFNELQEVKKASAITVFLSQFKDLLVIILIFAAVISGFLGEWESSVVIAFVILLNAILGTVQHMKAEHSLNSLKSLAAPLAKVLRDGQVIEIPSREVMVGDILQLDAGDFVSADGRIIEEYSLQINESSLTGESVAVEKTNSVIAEVDITLGDQKNMVFSGSFVTNGRAEVVVTSIGMQTEIGKIANLLGTAQNKKTPLQMSLDEFGKKLAFAIIIICIIIFALDLVRGRELVDSFMFAVSLAVAAIPEALSSIVTIVLAFGTQKMAKENAIIRHLHAVESLGSISVICSDKTGTLTQNKMEVQKVYMNGEIKLADQLHYDQAFDKNFIVMTLLCNNAVTVDQNEIGDPTEIALVNFGEKYDLDELMVRNLYPRLAELPFDSTRKLMSSVNEIDGKTYCITKGAVDVLIRSIEKIATVNGVVEATQDDINNIYAANHALSEAGLRVLAFAYKEMNESDKISIEDESELIFVGLTAMMDPPRAESKDAVHNCIQAGIKPIMITGDHKITAAAIAKQIGILHHSNEAIEGQEIEVMSDDELKARVEEFSVYARVSPEHKIRIVDALQQRGHVVAMTGDGVNDGPALKQSNIGVAMGITGTEVAKDAASMILTDDNFSTIVKAIANGRSIFTNIQNAIKFLLSGNTGAIFVVLYATLFALPAPFAPVHLLFINLLTDSLPAIAIGLEPHNKRVMKEKPRDIRVPILNKVFASRVLIEGGLIAVVVIIAYEIGRSSGDTMLASTMAFATLCLARLFHSFNCRTNDSIFRVGLFSNVKIWGAFLVGVGLLHVVLLVPFLSGIFEVASLQLWQFGAIYALAFIPVFLIQAVRLFRK